MRSVDFLSNHRITTSLGNLSQTSQNSLASDPASLTALTHSNQLGSRAGLEKAAQAFESMLIGQMMTQMRAASLGEGIFDSDASRLYQDLADHQMANLLSAGEGIGIRKALLRQLDVKTSDVTATGHEATMLKVPERNLRLHSIKSKNSELHTDQDSVDSIDSILSSNRSNIAASTATKSLTNFSATTQGNWPPQTPEEFVAYLKPYAEHAALLLGMDTSVLLAQSAHETGWGKHIPRREDGSSSYNLFGIKADRQWEGDRVTVGTLEYRAGVARREQAAFRAYANPADSFIDYINFLRRNPRYQVALASDNGEAFIRRLQQAGYATDPQYANKILAIRDRMTRIIIATSPVNSPTNSSNNSADLTNL